MIKKENQTKEFKESWRDEYLKTICAFANTRGGVLSIGVNDQGIPIGLSNCKKLLEDIPNQVRSALNILCDIKLSKIKGKELLEVKIKSEKNAVSYKGKYFKRSGSTTQELNGAELQNFLLEKANRSWESIIEDAAGADNIDSPTIDSFKKLCAKRYSQAASEKSIMGLLEKLHLLRGGKLTRAALLLFGKDPQQYFPSAYIKIGRYKDDATLLSMDEIKGNLFQQATGAIEILQKKYLFSDVRIEGLYREDILEFPEPALREAVVNAIVHKDYSAVTTFIKVYSDSITIWNNGTLTNRLTIEKLRKKHASFPRNELIAEAFFNAGLIEQWGSGTLRILKECKDAGLPEPLFEEESGGMQVTFQKNLITEDFLRKNNLIERQIKAVIYVRDYGKITNTEYQKITKISKRTASSDLQSLVMKGILEKRGATGKGTEYVLKRGNKGAKGAITQSVRAMQNDELDNRIKALENDLASIHPNDEVRWNMNKEVFFEMFDLWINEFLITIIPVIQKFNKLFNKPNHNIFVFNSIGKVLFTNEQAPQIVRELVEDCKKFKQEIWDASIQVNLNYGTFRKGGLKTFGCMYGMEIKINTIKYGVYMDKFNENQGVEKSVLQFERLLHKPLSQQEMKSLAKDLGETIYNHIDFYTRKEGLR